MVLSKRQRKHIIAKQRRRYYLWQLKRDFRHRWNLIQLWIDEQKADIPHIIEDIKNKRK